MKIEIAKTRADTPSAANTGTTTFVLGKGVVARITLDDGTFFEVTETGAHALQVRCLEGPLLIKPSVANTIEIERVR